MYQKILKEKRDENSFAINRLTKGLDVLALAQVEVNNMQQTLADSKPVLERTSVEIEETSKLIAV